MLSTVPGEKQCVSRASCSAANDQVSSTIIHHVLIINNNSMPLNIHNLLSISSLTLENFCDSYTNITLPQTVFPILSS